MLNSQGLVNPSIGPLDQIGAEPLRGSGFENEEQEEGFNSEPSGSKEVD